MNQIEIVCLEELVSKAHAYRKFKSVIDFRFAEEILSDCESDSGADGYGIFRLFMCLLVQFMEDFSDRELARYLDDSNAAKWFCGFGLTQKTPDHSLFTKVRKRIGTKRLSLIFSTLREQLKARGYMSEIFTFVDASHLVSKANLWEEKDKAIAKKYDKLNNEVLPKVANDKQARIGCKCKNKYWYGYKRNVSVDMQSGMINKVGIKAANALDDEGLENVCPSQGAAYADKGYCTPKARKGAAKRGVHLRAIKKNNMKDKNRDLDKWISKIRAPYERVFSQANHRARYNGIVKNQFAEFMYAIGFNLKRPVVLSEEPPPKFC